MDDNFDEILVEILNEQPASNLLSIPGIYEILAEHFNNDVLDHPDFRKTLTIPFYKTAEWVKFATR